MLFQIQKPVVAHTNLADFKKMLISIFCGSVVLLVFSRLSFNDDFSSKLDWPFYVIEFSFTFLLLVVRRMVSNELDTPTLASNKSSKNLVIVDSVSNGSLIIETIMKNPESGFSILAFVDTSGQMVGKMIQGIRVVSSNYIEENYLKDKVDLVLLANNDTKTIEKCFELGVQVKELPPIQNWLNMPISSQNLKKISIEQLLGRDEIVLDNEKLFSFLGNKIILVTGAAGSIGSELVHQIMLFNPLKIILFDQSETGLYDLEYSLKEKFPQYSNKWLTVVGDIGNVKRLDELFVLYHPTIVYHAAAYKHVPLMEMNPLEAIETNFIGTINLVTLAIKYTVETFVFISTDKAVNPTNVMGATKRASELFIQAIGKQSTTKFITTRFGNVLGSNGSVIPLFEKQISSGGPLTLTDERITRYFMTIKEASQLVLEASVMGEESEIFVFDMGKSVKIIDLAKKMIYLSGLKEGVDIKIECIGLRPGEKLFEELLATEETTSKTHHPKILIGKSPSIDYEKITTYINEMMLCLDTRSINDAIRILKKMIPEYKSNNSTFSSLD
jgi:FlaA1/EpsC-like NDP-sugar epimerase